MKERLPHVSESISLGGCCVGCNTSSDVTEKRSPSKNGRCCCWIA